MGSKLSNTLVGLGFFSALGTTESIVSEGHHVKRGTPRTWDSNNGVTVIYDEEGRPWIIRNNYDDEVADAIQVLIHDHDVQRGAYVPHSNDGGHFVCEVIPKL